MFNYFKSFFSSEDDQDPSWVRLIQAVLTAATLAMVGLAVIDVVLNPGKLGIGFYVEVILVLLSGMALFFSYRNIYWPGKLLVPLSALTAVTYLAINADGLHDSAISGFLVVIILTGLLTGRRAIPLATILTVLGTLTITLADMTGINKSVFSQRTGWFDAVVIAIIQIIAAAALNGLMTRLNSALETSRTNEQTQIKSNQELRELQAVLEQRVTARTQDLAIVAEVGTATATILDTNRLLQEVVDLTKERFNLYHSHIYLLDQAGKNLVLAAGAGEPGRQMKAKGLSIPLDREQSLVARAARERKGVTVNDVTQAPDFLPNPLLPNTHSELAVPMIVGGNLIGVFDVQSDVIGRFGESDISIQTTMAAQVATSIQNVRSFEQSKKQAELETLVNTIGQKIQRTATMEETLQTAIREIGLALGSPRVSVNIARDQNDGNDASQN